MTGLVRMGVREPSSRGGPTGIVTTVGLECGEPMEYRVRQYSLQQGALEIQYIEEFFGEFPAAQNGSLRSWRG